MLVWKQMDGIEKQGLIKENKRYTEKCRGLMNEKFIRK